jgi:monoamine oxidase
MTEPLLDSIVIGAGAAGLNAARILHKAGRKVLVLEARSRIGGRIQTLQQASGGEPIELGAEFVHGLPPETQALIDQRTELMERDGEYLIARGGPPQAEADYFEKLRSVLDRLDPHLTNDMSFLEFTEKLKPSPSAESVAMATQYVEGYHAADARQVSAQVLAQIETESQEENAVAGAFFMREGNHILVDRLAASIQSARQTILLEQRVEKIEWRPGHVSVHAIDLQGQTRIFHARTAIITIPVGVLQAAQGELGAVRFEPELPRHKQDAIHKLGMGRAIRVTFQFQEPFWETLPNLPQWAMLFDVSLHARLRTWWPRGNLLTGWIGGPKAEGWGDLAAQDLRELGVASISRIFGVPREKVDSLLLDAFSHDWTADPFSRGVYNFVKVGGLNAQQLLARAEGATLFFAGEATHPGGYSGTVNGALISGARAAQEILELT